MEKTDGRLILNRRKTARASVGTGLPLPGWVPCEGIPPLQARLPARSVRLCSFTGCLRHPSHLHQVSPGLKLHMDGHKISGRQWEQGDRSRSMAQGVGQPRTRLGKGCSRGRPGFAPVMLGDRACLPCQDRACCHRGPGLLPRFPPLPPAPAMRVTRSQGQGSLQAGHCSGQDRSPASCPRTPPVARATAHKKTCFYSIEQRLRCVGGREMDPADPLSEIQLLALVTAGNRSFAAMPLSKAQHPAPLRAPRARPRIPEPHPGSPASQPLRQRAVSVLCAGKRALHVELRDPDVRACVPALLEQWQMPRSPDES